MRRHTIWIALALVAALSACTGRPDKAPDAGSVQEPAPVDDPMASFARLVADEWRVTFKSGKSMFHTWHWGPGKHSLRRMTDGAGAGGETWRAVMVAYHHPGRKQVRLLGLEPVLRGVGEGTIRFIGEAAEADLDLHQTGGRRKLRVNWAFDGPDKFHESLLEATARGGLTPLTEWDQIRSPPPAPPRPRAVDGAKPSARLKALEPLLGHAREASGDWATGDAFHAESTFEWIPLADAIYIRVHAPSKAGEARHLLDAYLYHHTGANALRCLALSDRGGVYEGDLTVLEGGALQLDLNGYEGDRVVPLVVRLDVEPGGALRQRVWSVQGTERTLLLDVRHTKREPKTD